MSFAKFLRTPFFSEHFWWLLLHLYFWEYFDNFLSHITVAFINQSYVNCLTLSGRWTLSFNRNQPIDLLCKSVYWFLYDRDFRHERVKRNYSSCSQNHWDFFRFLYSRVKISQVILFEEINWLSNIIGQLFLFYLGVIWKFPLILKANNKIAEKYYICVTLYQLIEVYFFHVPLDRYLFNASNKHRRTVSMDIVTVYLLLTLNRLTAHCDVFKLCMLNIEHNSDSWWHNSSRQ